MLMHIAELQGFATTSPNDVSAFHSGVPPQTATTASSTVSDIPIVALQYQNNATSPYTPNSGYVAILDTNNGGVWRAITLLNPTAQPPFTNFSYTASGGTSGEVCVAAFKTA
jgi:hypothetical protein